MDGVKDQIMSLFEVKAYNQLKRAKNFFRGEKETSKSKT